MLSCGFPAEGGDGAEAGLAERVGWESGSSCPLPGPPCRSPTPAGTQMNRNPRERSLKSSDVNPSFPRSPGCGYILESPLLRVHSSSFMPLAAASLH